MEPSIKKSARTLTTKYELFFMWTNQSFFSVLNLHVIVAHIWTWMRWMCARSGRRWTVNGTTPHSWITLILFNRFSIHQLNCFLPSRPSTCAAAAGLAFAIDDFPMKYFFKRNLHLIRHWISIEWPFNHPKHVLAIKAKRNWLFTRPASLSGRHSGIRWNRFNVFGLVCDFRF